MCVTTSIVMLRRNLARISSSLLLSRSLLLKQHTQTLIKQPPLQIISLERFLSTKSGGGGDDKDKDKDKDAWSKGWDSSPSPASSEDWDSISSWSTGLTKDHFDGEAVGCQITPTPPPPPSSSSKSKGEASLDVDDDNDDDVSELERENKKSEKYVNSWDQRMTEVDELMKHVREPGVRGSYLRDSDKAEIYRLHKDNPHVYTIDKLAKDYRVMRQRVHAILWLKEIEEEEEKKHGPLDDSVELLLDTCPEFFISHDREFHVASLPYKPDFKVMPEGWDGTTRDPDEVHYEISMKEDEMLYQEFVQRMKFNKMKMAGEVKCHKYSRRCPSEGWNFTVEKLGPKGKRGGGGSKYVSMPDGSSRPLNEKEKMYVKRETVRRRRKILP